MIENVSEVIALAKENQRLKDRLADLYMASMGILVSGIIAAGVKGWPEITQPSIDKSREAWMLAISRASELL